MCGLLPLPPPPKNKYRHCSQQETFRPRAANHSVAARIFILWYELWPLSLRKLSESISRSTWICSRAAKCLLRPHMLHHVPSGHNTIHSSFILAIIWLISGQSSFNYNLFKVSFDSNDVRRGTTSRVGGSTILILPCNPQATWRCWSAGRHADPYTQLLCTYLFWNAQHHEEKTKCCLLAHVLLQWLYCTK